MIPSTHHTGLHYVEHNVRPIDKDRAGDCVTRAIVMATELSYDEVWDYFTTQKIQHGNKRGNADTGVDHLVAKNYLHQQGFRYTACPPGTKFIADNLPAECIVNLSSHYTYVKNGIVYDTYDCRGKRKRRLLGYFTFITPDEDYL